MIQLASTSSTSSPSLQSAVLAGYDVMIIITPVVLIIMMAFAGKLITLSPVMLIDSAAGR
jgi:hypothetical protein